MHHAISLTERDTGTQTPAHVRMLAASLLLSGVFVATTLLLRPPLPIDETRYLTVAWEMWQSGDRLVPHLNGEAYSHKPPLLFWLINAVWMIAGPSEWAARLVPAMFMPASVILTWRLGRMIEGPELGARAALVLSSIAVFAVMGTAVLFDAMLTTAVLLALIGLVNAGQGSLLRGMGLLAIALGIGALAKGPVILVHTLPAALLAPLWLPGEKRSWTAWYLGLLGALAAGTAIGLCWAIPAAMAGGSKFGELILWEQSSGRVVSAFAHKRPFWFYLPLLPMLLFPWVLSRRIWGNPAGWLAGSRLWRLPLIVVVADFVLFSAISSKQIHYLLPALPAAALLLAHKLGPDVDEAPAEDGFYLFFALGGAGVLVALLVAPRFYPAFPPIHPEVGIVLMTLAAPAWWLRHSLLRVAPLASLALVLIAHVEGRFTVLPSHDLRWIDARLKRATSIAVVGGYQGEFGFGARLDRPVTVLKPYQVTAWRREHPHGAIVSFYKERDRNLDGQPLVAHPYRGGWLGLWAPVEPSDAVQEDDAPAPR
ncbi:ArnT family glycosyltransferase [Ancylobacter terrae]|uniref:ArnT family glycosyltransferase n=1 Tax=Ancylobacter sp. sgz301288 TaxID=3342077 RepID=UPI00385ACC21